jgi:uncharacterized damage-inducible protein DinB
MVIDARSSTADLDDARAKLIQSFAPLDDAMLDEAGVVGDWSIRQALAHLLAWDAWGVHALAALERGDDLSQPNDDTMNRSSFEQIRHLPGRDLQDRLRTSRADLVTSLAAMSDEERANPRYELGDRLISADDFVDGFIEHDKEHASEIRAWRKSRGIC